MRKCVDEAPAGAGLKLCHQPERQSRPPVTSAARMQFLVISWSAECLPCYPAVGNTRRIIHMGTEQMGQASMCVDKGAFDMAPR